MSRGGNLIDARDEAIGRLGAAQILLTDANSQTVDDPDRAGWLRSVALEQIQTSIDLLAGANDVKEGG